MLVKECNNNEKPRERFLKYGNNVSNEDLLSILIRCGTKSMSCKDISSLILGSIDNVSCLKDLRYEELLKFKGIGKDKAITLLSALELGKRVYYENNYNKVKLNNSSLIYQYFRGKFLGLHQEEFYCAFLDNKNNLISYKKMFIGTVNASITHPREVFKEAVKVSSSFIVIMHNHPTGDPTPSKEDILFTNTISKSGEILGIKMIDHIIFGSSCYYSFYESMNKNIIS